MAKTMKKVLSPTALEAWRDLGVILKKFRNAVNLSKQRLSQKIGISAARIDGFERALVFPESEEISQYIKAALQLDYFPNEILEAFSEAQDKIKGFDCELADSDSQHMKVEFYCADRNDECDIWESAIKNPKALLEGARWLPTRSQIRIERINFWERFLAKYDDTITFLLQYLNRPDLVSDRGQSRLAQLIDSQESVVNIVKEHCADLAKEAQSLLARYKRIGSIFDTYASDLPGYTLAKNQFFFGMTLDEALSRERYTRRWAQTLQARTLQIFRDRIGEIYDKRGTGPFN